MSGRREKHCSFGAHWNFRDSRLVKKNEARAGGYLFYVTEWKELLDRLQGQPATMIGVKRIYAFNFKTHNSFYFPMVTIRPIVALEKTA
jgi:hypothetical protein